MGACLREVYLNVDIIQCMLVYYSEMLNIILYVDGK